MPLSARQRELVQHLWREGRLSRSDLCLRMRLSANSVGALTAELIQLGVLRECEPEPSRGGRPRVPLEIDPTRCNVVGLAINPGHVTASRVNLCGQRLGRGASQDVADPERLSRPVGTLIRQAVNDRTLGIGIAATGFVDPATWTILLSSATSGRPSVSLESVRDQAEGRPVVIENDMHALAARWLLTHRADTSEDVLLVYLDDGSLGAAVIVDGKPNRGCVIGGNELGHTRFPIQTPPCYCGQTGCLERIASTAFLKQHGAADDASLRDMAQRYADDDDAMREMIRLLAMGLSNAVNFVRPHRLVLVSEMTRYPGFCNPLLSSVRRLLLPELMDRVRIDTWDQPVTHSSETAGWLAIASLFCDGWQPEALAESPAVKRA